MSIIISLLVNALAVFVAAYFTPGVEVASFMVALIASIALGILNTILKPILKLLTLPITILTLGLFSLVINVAMILLASYLVDGFSVDGFWAALIFSLVLSLVNWFLSFLKD